MNSSRNKVAVHGHRGARARFPENTIAGFEYAISVGVDAIELDVVTTRDAIAVVSHDPEFYEPSRLVISELTFEEVRERVPSLDEVFALAGRGEFLFNVEIKSAQGLTPPPEELARIVVETIGRGGVAPRCIVKSFDFRVLHAVRELAPQIPRAALYSGPPRDFVAIAREADAQIVSIDFPLVTAAQVAAAHAEGIAVLCWTPNSPAEWQPLIAAGVDGIITDDPEALIRWGKL